MNCSVRCGMKSFVLVVILIVIEKKPLTNVDIHRRYIYIRK